MKITTFILDLVNPKWLKKIDRYLLLNYSRFWVTKIHYVFYYGLLTNIVLNILVWIFLEPQAIDEFIRVFIVFVMFAEASIFIFWLIQQSLYNVEKEYGNNFHNFYGISLAEALVYMLCTVIIISTSLTMTASAIYKTASVLEIKPQQEHCGEINKYKVTPDKSDNQDICNDIKDFIDEDYLGYGTTDYLGYDVQHWFHTIFLGLGIFLLIARKYGNWRSLALILGYILVLITISIFFGIFINTFSSYDADLFVLNIVIINIFIFGGAILLTRTKKTNEFMFINFATLPISLGVLVCVLGFNIYDHWAGSSFMLILFFVLFTFFVPLYKAVLNRYLSLPKE